MALLGGGSWLPAHAHRGSSVMCAAPALFSMGDRTWKTDRTSWSGAKVMEYVDLEPRGITPLRVACRSCASGAMMVVLCHVAFHEEDLVLAPCLDPCLPIWSRCISLDD